MKYRILINIKNVQPHKPADKCKSKLQRDVILGYVTIATMVIIKTGRDDDTEGERRDK